jgi:hypothetical protein
MLFLSPSQCCKNQHISLTTTVVFPQILVFMGSGHYRINHYKVFSIYINGSSLFEFSTAQRINPSKLSFWLVLL